MATFVGLLQEVGAGGLVRTSGKTGVGDIFIPENRLGGAPFGMLVVVEVEGDPPPLNPSGRVKEVLGDPALPDIAMLGIIREFGLLDKFSDAELKAAERVPAALSENIIATELANGRKDLRTLQTMTIDGKDAKDLDDAISIMALPDQGIRLWVHIADVSHYVKENAPLDQAAQLRGNSVYLADRVLPMLPPRLSNGICSLNPDQDRLALTVLLDFNASGAVERGEIFESIIRSDLRANYEDVYAAAYRDEAPELYRGPLPELRLMRVLAERLKARREAKGCLNFDFPETKVILAPDGQSVEDIRAYPTNAANGIIEEFMIAANVFVAKKFENLGVPFLFRVHEQPDPIKMQRFLDLARGVGLKLKRFDPNDTLSLAQALETIQESPLGPALSQLLLQSLAKARYDARCLGHFGLAEHFYTHFTSPIRRYPDLFIHRVIKASLRGRVQTKRWSEKAPMVAEHCSATERSAMYAEFASVDQKVAEYMKNHLGENYHGQIVSMMSSGLFVRLDNSAEGFLPFRNMDDYFEYNEERLEAFGRTSGRRLRIGQTMEVMVARADVETRQVDFAPAGTDLASLSQKRSERRKDSAPALQSEPRRGGVKTAKQGKSKAEQLAKERRRLEKRLKKQRKAAKQKLKADTLRR